MQGVVRGLRAKCDFAWRRPGAPLRSSAAFVGGAGRFVQLEPAREPTGVVSMASGSSPSAKACGKEAILPTTLGRHLKRREIHSSRRMCSEDKDKEKDKDRKRLPSDDPSQVRKEGFRVSHGMGPLLPMACCVLVPKHLLANERLLKPCALHTHASCPNIFSRKSKLQAGHP
jgi:hypothetical protein